MKSLLGVRLERERRFRFSLRGIVYTDKIGKTKTSNLSNGRHHFLTCTCAFRTRLCPVLHIINTRHLILRKIRKRCGLQLARLLSFLYPWLQEKNRQRVSHALQKQARGGIHSTMESTSVTMIAGRDTCKAGSVFPRNRGESLAFSFGFSSGSGRDDRCGSGSNFRTARGLRTKTLLLSTAPVFLDRGNEFDRPFTFWLIVSKLTGSGKVTFRRTAPGLADEGRDASSERGEIRGKAKSSTH